MADQPTTASSSYSSALDFRPFLPEKLLERLKSDPLLKDYSSTIYTEAFQRFRLKTPPSVDGEMVYVGLENSPFNTFPALHKQKEEILEKWRKRCMDAGWLHQAAREGDVPLAYECIRIGLCLNDKNPRGATPLFVACETFRELDKKLKSAVRRKPAAKASTLRGNGFGPLASLMSHFQRVEHVTTLLTEQIANVNACINNGTPVDIAISISYWSFVKLLIRHGALVPLPNASSIFRSQEHKDEFGRLVASLDNPPESRPMMACPCWSGLRADECHGDKAQPYLLEFICKCGSHKSYAQCCAKTPNRIEEEWDMDERMIMSVLRRTITVPAQMAKAMRDIGEMMNESEENREMIQRAFQAIQADEKSVVGAILETMPGIDPAFKYASKQIGVMARPWLDHLSKARCKFAMDNWNNAVDKYIASGVDSRPRFEIELETKVSVTSGPMYKHCEADGCTRIEGREVDKMKWCGRCKRIFYCSQQCQVDDWPSHKATCKAGTHPEQLLPSQRAIMHPSFDISNPSELQLTMSGPAGEALNRQMMESMQQLELD